MRLNIDPESLVPKLPKPAELRPYARAFPTLVPSDPRAFRPCPRSRVPGGISIRAGHAGTALGLRVAQDFLPLPCRYPTHLGVEYVGHVGRVQALSLSPSGQWLCSAGQVHVATLS